MTDAKAVPKGLKDQEVERGNRTKRPPIPYISESDEAQDTVNRAKDQSMKIKFTDKSELNVPIWDSGTGEAFLNHVNLAINACTRKGLFRDWEEADDKAADLTEQIATLTEEISDALKPNTQRPLTKEALKEKKSLLKVKQEKLEEVLEEKKSLAEQFFSLYANLLSEDARYVWDKIVQSQVGCAPWTDLQGKEHERARAKTRYSFEDCVTMHLLHRFPNDAAETQRYYISNVLKKPQRVPVRPFFQRVEQLNSYLSRLLCLYDSPSAVATTKSVVPYDDSELAMMLLRMCPESWVDQYNLTQEYVPQSTRALLTVLENIEKCDKGASAPSKATSNGHSTGASNGNSDKSGKRKGMNSSSDRIPKKARNEKHCVLCKQHGGAHTTHNTNECKRYNKDGTLKKGWSKPASGSAKPDHQSFAQLSKQVAKLKAAYKKGKKGSSRGKKRSYDSSSDSDSE